MKRTRFFLCLSLLFSVCCLSVYASKPPEWIDGYREDLPNSYLEVVFGDGRTMEEAQNIAAKNIVKSRNLGAGQRAEVTVNNSLISVKGSRELLVKAHIIDTYTEYRGAICRVYLLVQILKHPSFTFEPVRVTNRYPFSARVFVPGMAQIYKGQTERALALLPVKLPLSAESLPPSAYAPHTNPK